MKTTQTSIGAVACYLFEREYVAGGKNSAIGLIRIMKLAETSTELQSKTSMANGHVHVQLDTAGSRSMMVCGTISEKSYDITEEVVQVPTGLPATVAQRQRESIRRGAVLSNLIDVPFMGNRRVRKIATGEDRTAYFFWEKQIPTDWRIFLRSMREKHPHIEEWGEA